jgi:hypothetical protein
VGVRGIGHVKSLHVLDVQDCIDVSPECLADTTLRLPRLIEVNATNIRQESTTYLAEIRARTGDSNFPVGLCLVNGRFQTWGSPRLDSRPYGYCSVRTQVQRLDGSTPKAVMYHCIDCRLIPSVDRGICACCVSTCHRGHNTFVGEWTRFYCDCSFGCAGNECEAVFPTSLAAPIATTATHAVEAIGENTDTVVS